MTDELAQTTESSGPAAEGGGGATLVPEVVRASGSEPDLSDPSLYFNRELSWLDFNDRVLQLAEDPRVPLLERVNFSAIYEDNLDEFFMVRVAGLHEKVEEKIDARGADAMAPADVLGLIRQRTIELRERLDPLLRGRDPAAPSPSTGSGSSRSPTQTRRSGRRSSISSPARSSRR